MVKLTKNQLVAVEFEWADKEPIEKLVSMVYFYRPQGMIGIRVKIQDRRIISNAGDFVFEFDKRLQHEIIRRSYAYRKARDEQAYIAYCESNELTRRLR